MTQVAQSLATPRYDSLGKEHVIGISLSPIFTNPFFQLKVFVLYLFK